MWVSASLVASAGVVGLVGPLSGRLGDRVDRRRVMVVAEIAGAVGWLLVLLADRPVTLVLFALLATAANAPFKAAASAVGTEPRRGGGPVLGERHHRHRHQRLAAGRPAASEARSIGAAGPEAVYALNIVSFLVSAVVISRLRGTFAADRDADLRRRPRSLADGRR